MLCCKHNFKKLLGAHADEDGLARRKMSRLQRIFQWTWVTWERKFERLQKSGNSLCLKRNGRRAQELDHDEEEAVDESKEERK